jgi:hypothetical protein
MSVAADGQRIGHGDRR